MSEEIKKGMEKLNGDDLEQVNGGAGFSDFVDALFGKTAKAAPIPNVVKTSECCAGAAPETAKQSNTIVAMCPVCGKQTEFTLFTGARARCNVCGNIRLDM